MTTVLIILGLAAIAAAFWYFKFRKANKSPNADPSVFASTVFIESHSRGNTPKGAKVYSYLPDVSMEVREAIDRGMQQTFNIAAESYFYTEALKHSDYKVSVWPRSSKCEGVGFLMAGYPIGERGYDQTDYDKDRTPGHYEICVAGEFRLFNNELAISVVNDAAMAEIGARFETEHAVTLKNDPDLYAKTYDHSQGGGHPILVGEQDHAAVGLLSRPAFKCSGGADPRSI